MNRILLFLALVVAFTTLSADMVPNIFAGFGWSWFTGKDAKDFDELESSMGFMVGASIESLLPNSPIVMEYGARFRTAGAQAEYEDEGYSNYEQWSESGSREWNLSYIDIFGKFKYELPVGDAVYLRPYVGYSAGILVSAEYEYEYEYSIYYYDGYYTYSDSGSDSDTEDFKKECNTLNNAMLFGAEVLLGEKFTLGIEYNMGFTELLKKSRSADWTISGFMFRASMSF